jgi:hypothetical protein
VRRAWRARRTGRGAARGARSRSVQREPSRTRTAGDDKLGWHDDYDKKRYGASPVIASVSFGAERAFQMRRKADNADKYEFQLGGGAVLVMAGSCQATWEHSVPARAKAPGERINLTFRHVIVQA